MIDSIEVLEEQLDKVIFEKEKCLQEMNVSNGKKHEILRQKYYALNEKYWLIKDKLTYHKGETVIENDEIKLIRSDGHLENIYWIYLKDSMEKVGHIDYQGYHSSLIEGDIGYFIDCRYNGHNYAYKSLCLLSDYLLEKGVTDFYISAFHDNIASTKIIRKYGGVAIRQDSLITTYQCETRKTKSYHK